VTNFDGVGPKSTLANHLIVLKMKDNRQGSNMDYTREFEVFDAARRYWLGTKRGGPTEFANFRKHHKDWKEVLSLLLPAIEAQEFRRFRMAKKGEFVPPLKHFQTWINNRCWEEVEGREYTEDELRAKERLEAKKHQRALEKKRQDKREEWQVCRDWPKEKLIEMRKDRSWLHLWWLLDEILNERNRQKDRLGVR